MQKFIALLILLPVAASCQLRKKSDYEILTLLYTANTQNMLRWNLNDSTMKSWKGVFLDGEGEVIGLKLDSRNITVIPPEVGQLRKLQKLDLQFNDITTLPIEIGELNNLRVLILYENNLTSIPSSIGDLDNLTELYLGRNQLTEVPE